MFSSNTLVDVYYYYNDTISVEGPLKKITLGSYLADCFLTEDTNNTYTISVQDNQIIIKEPSIKLFRIIVPHGSEPTLENVT